MRGNKQAALVIAIVALVPILPVLAVGWWLEPWITDQLGNRSTESTGGPFVVAVLASDILLPIPSSAVCAWAGMRFGIPAGTAWCWLGLTLGCVAGYAMARYGGRALTERLADQETMRQLARLSLWGAWLLVLTRPIPVFGEVAVLLMGINQFAWLPFLLVIGTSNLAVALVFVAAGQFASSEGWFPVAIVVVVAAPAIAAALVRRMLRRSTEKLGNQHRSHDHQDQQDDGDSKLHG